MCTVSWLHQTGGYHLLCNRDEKRTRAKGLGPRVEKSEGVHYIAPVDGEFGGTWIAVNEFGVSLCLLNGADLTPTPGWSSPPGSQSRGQVLRRLIAANSRGGCADRLSQLELTPYAPFTIVMLEPDQPAMLAQWDGQQRILISAGASSMPLTSSSFDPGEVRRRRLLAFKDQLREAPFLRPEHLYRFHFSHAGQPSAYSPCMHREDAETVSFSAISVRGHAIRFYYSDAPPCRRGRTERQFLLRAA